MQYPKHTLKNWGGPKFLFRAYDPAAVRAVEAVLSRKIDWAKPRDPAIAKEEARRADVARLNSYVQNRAAPVEVSYQPKGSKHAELLRRFANMDEFEAWYKPAVHHCTYAYASDSVTMLFSSLPDWEVKRMMGPPKTAKTPPKVKTTPASTDTPAKTKTPGKPCVAKSGRYVDIRHVRQMAEAGYDFNPATNTFTKGKVSVAIEPPPAGKTWSSSWTVKGVSGRGIGALLKALRG